MCPKDQKIIIHTDSKRVIKAITQPDITAKSRVHTKYQAEKDLIKIIITKQKINLQLKKEKAHQTVRNQQADQLAKQGTTSIIQFVLNVISSILLDQSKHPISQDSWKWIKHKY